MATIFLVSGSTGEYSDYSQWTVRAFSTREAADAFAAKANAWLKERRFHRDGPLADFEVRDEAESDFDSELRVDYTGSDYAVLGPFPLDDEVSR